jgi:hypothetical protein
MAKATMRTRKEIIARHKRKYDRLSKKQKGLVLDSICMDTGLSRSRAKHLLAKSYESAPSATGRGRKTKYGPDVVKALEKIWAYMDFACGRRLTAGMDDMLGSLWRFNEIDIDSSVQLKLRQMSPSTADRLLRRAKEPARLRGASTTKPGTLLKKDIPLRLGTEWSDAIPGYVEIDLVAHCGDTTAGEYVNTLDVTDIYSGWTETEAVINKAQKHVFEALLDIGKRQPFPYLGIDSDNGSEFINNHLYRYCKENHICFTRSRPFQKNDSCHVEQKNWNVVRRNIGYGRYEGREAVDVMNEYYSLLRLHTNFFLPQTKLISRTRDGARIRKTYTAPLTPYRRLLGADCIPDTVKACLKETYASLNPAGLKRSMMRLLERLTRLRVAP